MPSFGQGAEAQCDPRWVIDRNGRGVVIMKSMLSRWATWGRKDVGKEKDAGSGILWSY